MTESGVKFVNSLNDAVNGNVQFKSVSRAVTAALILGNKSPSSASSTRPSTPSGSVSPSLASSSRASTPRSSTKSSNAGALPPVAPHSVTKVERCQCCDIDEFWRVYDSFCLMDKQGCGSVRRCDFWEAFTDHVTKEMIDTMTKAKLHQRFRASAADMTFQELLERIWPAATASDRKMMNHWARLRDVSLIISSRSFRGTRQNMKQIFDLLDADGSEMICPSELVRARILTKDELKKLMQEFHEMFGGRQESRTLNFGEFKVIAQKHFLEKYANDLWEDPCRSAFQVSKKNASLGPGTKIDKVLSRRSALNQGSIIMAC